MTTSLIGLILLSAFFVIILFFLYIYLCFKKVKEHRMDLQKRKWLSEWKGELEYYLQTGELNTRIVLHDRVSFETVEQFFSHQLRIVKDEQTRQRIYDFAERYLYSFYERKLSHPQWGTRLNALISIEHFRLSAALQMILKRLGDQRITRNEKLQIFLVLASFEYTYIYQVLCENAKEIPDFICRMVLHRLPEEQLLLFIPSFKQSPASIQGNLLDVLRERNVRTLEYLQLIEELLIIPETSAELRIRALKSISQFGFMQNPEIIISLIHQHDWSKRLWTERMMAARLMGSIRKEVFLPLLEQAIADEFYLVRYEAAQSLMKYLNGKERLEKIASQHDDRFARDMAKEWLAKEVV